MQLTSATDRRWRAGRTSTAFDNQRAQPDYDCCFAKHCARPVAQTFARGHVSAASRQIIPANLISGVNSTRKTRFLTEEDSALTPKSTNFANNLLLGQEFNFLLMIRGWMPGIIRTSTPKSRAWRFGISKEAR